jgi:hypothetical protein
MPRTEAHHLCITTGAENSGSVVSDCIASCNMCQVGVRALSPGLADHRISAPSSFYRVVCCWAESESTGTERQSAGSLGSSLQCRMQCYVCFPNSPTYIRDTSQLGPLLTLGTQARGPLEHMGNFLAHRPLGLRWLLVQGKETFFFFHFY